MNPARPTADSAATSSEVSPQRATALSLLITAVAPTGSVPLIGALKLVAVIILAEVSSQGHSRCKGTPHLLVDTADDNPRRAQR